MDTKNENSTRKGRRGEKTIEQLLAAGVEAFAKYGPEGVTTRQLAKAASVNSAAIAYYFGGKEGYYLAVVRHLISERAKPILSLLTEISEEFKRSDRSPEVAGALLMRFLRNLTIAVLQNPYARFIASISSREHLHPTAAFEIIYDVVSRIHGILSELIGCATETSADSPDTIIRAHALLGQVFFFRIASTTACRRLSWDAITEKRAEHIAEIVAEMACRAIGIESADGYDRKLKERS
ncbi:CerR family C-terminal domain-containing protein [Desulfovulcanus sp.]